MSEPVPTFAGWYPDAETDGTKYWDGARWTGDARPHRKPFAAAAGEYRQEGFALMAFGGMCLLMSPFASALNDGSVSTVGLFLVLFVSGIAVAAGGVYLFRGQGPTTQAVEQRLAAERKAGRKSDRRATILAAIGQLRRPTAPSVVVNVATQSNSDSAAAAQIHALANPETAMALRNLQSLLVAGVLSESEFQAAKDRLFGNPRVSIPAGWYNDGSGRQRWWDGRQWTVL